MGEIVRVQGIDIGVFTRDMQEFCNIEQKIDLFKEQGEAVNVQLDRNQRTGRPSVRFAEIIQRAGPEAAVGRMENVRQYFIFSQAPDLLCEISGILQEGFAFFPV